MQLHLDPVGGVAGDMFVAALLDAFPEHEAGLLESVALAAPETSCAILAHNDGVMQGRRFSVTLDADGDRGRADGQDHHPANISSDHHHHHHHDYEPAAHAAHGHRPWAQIRTHLGACGLSEQVARHAIGIFARLAMAEGRVHGVDPEQVEFHEVGGWDSIADIVGAAHLIAALGVERWTVGPLPLGGGRIHTAHGVMSAPAPATTILLEGFMLIDDGVSGERVTPTGAAILNYLAPRAHGDGRSLRLIRSGAGFGTRSLPGLSNCLRVMAFETVGTDPEIGTASEHRELLVVEFEVDDQSSEDLAMGLDRLRAHPDVFDAVQTPVFGKKGRFMASIRLLARPERLDAVIAAVFEQTTTIGLRHHIVRGAALPRRQQVVETQGHRFRVKVVERPGGATAKAESDDALAHETHARRATLRRAAEMQALTVDAAAEPTS